MQETNSGYVVGDQVSHLEYQQCGSRYKYNYTEEHWIFKFLIYVYCMFLSITAN